MDWFCSFFLFIMFIIEHPTPFPQTPHTLTLISSNLPDCRFFHLDLLSRNQNDFHLVSIIFFF